MPELPEVETVKRKLEPFILNKTIIKVNVYYEKHKILEKLNNERVTKLDRLGKYLIIYLEKYCLISHLRMEGKYRIDEKPLIGKHDLVEFVFKDFSLIYNDVRRFGVFYLFDIKDDIFNLLPLANLGKEPFYSDGEYLLSAIKNKTMAIKTLLLDQSILAGLGNIYVDEVLFIAGINPKRSGSSISKEEADKIIDASRKVLESAIECGGTTIIDYESLNGEEGHFQTKLLVHQKEGQKCSICANIIMKMKVGGRGTYFCPTCQPLKEKKIYGITGSFASGKSSVLSFIKSLGFSTISLDEISKEFYETNSPMKREILKHFKTIDKDKIVHIVTKDKDEKEILERITHKAIINEMNKRIIDDKSDIVFVEAPLLFESHMEKIFTKIIDVYESDEIKGNILKAKGITRVKEIALSQLSKEEKAQKADFIIKNDNDLNTLKTHTINLLKQLEVLK